MINLLRRLGHVGGQQITRHFYLNNFIDEFKAIHCDLAEEKINILKE